MIKLRRLFKTLNNSQHGGALILRKSLKTNFVERHNEAWQAFSRSPYRFAHSPWLDHLAKARRRRRRVQIGKETKDQVYGERNLPQLKRNVYYISWKVFLQMGINRVSKNWHELQVWGYLGSVTTKLEYKIQLHFCTGNSVSKRR